MISTSRNSKLNDKLVARPKNNEEHSPGSSMILERDWR